MNTEDSPNADEQRLAGLDRLVFRYNKVHPLTPIHSLDCDDADRLVLKLWTRKIKVPSELTFGEPYDSVFKGYIFDYAMRVTGGDPEYELNEEDSRNLEPYRLLGSEGDQLKYFLAFSLALPQFTVTSETEEAKLGVFDSFCAVLPAPKGFLIHSYADFRKILNSDVLSRLDLVYLALVAHSHQLYKESSQLDGYFSFVSSR